MSDVVVVAIITSATSLFLALVNFVSAMAQKRQSKKSGINVRLDNIEKNISEIKSQNVKLSEHNELQYLSLLRLTVMDSDMPMSERLIAGKEYIGRGGNGDVKMYYDALEKSINK